VAELADAADLKSAGAILVGSSPTPGTTLNSPLKQAVLMPLIKLGHKETVLLTPLAPYNFNANFHKPSHFPSSDNIWEQDKYWITMLWKGQELGLKFENAGTIDEPQVRINIYSQEALAEDFFNSLVPEIRRRFNFDSDISEFHAKFKGDELLGATLEKWKGMKPVAANSLYETLVIYIVLQNATVRRSVQMLENLFDRFGKKLDYDGKVLSTFWKPEKMAKSSEQELRDLKLGYRAKFLIRITEQFVNGEIDEFALREMPRDEVSRKMLKLYGIGPASVEYLLFEDFYFCDTLETIPPWEQKIISRLIFNEKSVSIDRLLGFFRKFEGWEKLAFHYIWEDVFWKRKHEHIEWLEKEIRL
jgi:3-methyladenine DNA glycosylase/8-oxoguanine DNA glycosylase